MSKEDILSYFTSNAYSFNVKQTLFMLIFSLLIGLVIYVTYYLCSEKVTYNKKYNLSIVVTTLITNVIMMLISSNVVVSLGMVGALSIVRFRTAIKDSRDTVFMFWAISEGLCVGTRSYKVCVVSTLFIALVFVLGSKLVSGYNKYLLVIAGSQQMNIEPIEKVIENKKYRYILRSSNSNEKRNEYIYELKLRGKIDSSIIKEFQSMNDIYSVNCVIETGEIEG